MDQEIKEFSAYKEEILKALNLKLQLKQIKIDEKAQLVDGFFVQSFQNTLAGIQLGGPAIPSIALVGESGQIYFFALKALLPNLEI